MTRVAHGARYSFYRTVANNTIISSALGPEMHEAVHALAHSLGVSPSKVVRAALLDYLPRLETALQLRLEEGQRHDVLVQEPPVDESAECTEDPASRLTA